MPMRFKRMGFRHCCCGVPFPRTSSFDPTGLSGLAVVLKALSSPLPELRRPEQQQPSFKQSLAPAINALEHVCLATQLQPRGQHHSLKRKILACSPFT